MRNASLILLLLVLTGVPALAQDRPGTQLRRLGENLAKLDLTPEQQVQVRQTVDEMIARLEDIRRNARPGEREMSKIVDVLSDGRTKLTGILNADQQFRLRELMQQDRAEQAKAPEPKVARVEPKPAEPKKTAPPAVKRPEPRMGEDMMGGDGSPGRAGPAAPAGPVGPPLTEPGSAIAVGAEAPLFALKATTDRPYALSGFKGRVVVLVFGSYTSPSFRQRAAALEKLAKETQTKAAFFVIYTREAHAVGEWEVDRNKDDNILIEQPTTEAQRRELAKQAVTTLKLTIPVLVDGMDDAVTKAYGVAPNGAVVIGRDGKVFARQRWFEPLGLRQHIDAAAAVRNPTN